LVCSFGIGGCLWVHFATVTKVVGVFVAFSCAAVHISSSVPPIFHR
jgi:hypothetical protein